MRIRTMVLGVVLAAAAGVGGWGLGLLTSAAPVTAASSLAGTSSTGHPAAPAAAATTTPCHGHGGSTAS